MLRRRTDTIPGMKVDDNNPVVLTVTQLNRRARQLLETHFPVIRVEGEISNLARPSSGHIYFTLKDEQAQVRAAMFRQNNMRLGFRPENGQHVLIRGRVGLYEGRGEYQIIVEHMEDAGHGALQKRFDELKQALSEEGLFDQSHRIAIPAYPKRLGVITSPTGAAIHDVLTVLRRRYPALPVCIYPTAVQGEEAITGLCEAVRWANRDFIDAEHQVRRCDVLLLTRGGGPLEDLWAFNEEAVARAIFESSLPIVSAVGHEVDFTIADFVADLRAPTPSAAAEILSPDGTEILTQLSSYRARLSRLLDARLQQLRNQLDSLKKRLRHPRDRLSELAQRIDNLELRLRHSVSNRLANKRNTVDRLQFRLSAKRPDKVVQTYRDHHASLEERLNRSVKEKLQTARAQLGALSGLMDALSPLRTIERGYAIVTDSDQRIVRATSDVRRGDEVRAQLTDGSIRLEVLGKEPVNTDANSQSMAPGKSAPEDESQKP
ncbi:MAG: exodeoxyribonuclease VII large subunit [bacterium]